MTETPPPAEAPKPETPLESEEERMLAAALERGEWDIAIEIYEERTQKSRDPRVVGGAYKAMGQIALEKLQNPDRARVYFEMAREQQQGDPEILEPLGRLYLEAGRLPEARGVLERLVKARDPEENPQEISRVAEDYRRLGRLALKMDEPSRALDYYRSSWDFEPDHQETLENLVDLCQRSGHEEDADIFEKALLYHHRQNLSEERLAEILTRAGMRRLEEGDRALALLKLLTALEVAPRLKGPREAVVQLYEKEESWPDVLTHRRALDGILEDPRERAENLRQIGEIYLTRFKDEDRALAAFQSAASAAPGDRNILGYLKKFYSERGEWKAIVTLQEQYIATLENPTEKSQAYEELASLLAEKLNNRRGAIEALHRALDADPKRTRCFDLLNEHLVQLGDLAGLEESFRRMISRVGEGADKQILLALYIGLGNVCREARKRKEAAEAYEHASSLAPQDPRYRETLADIYREDPATFPRAIEQHRQLLQMDPKRLPSLHALYDLYSGSDPERAFLVAGALCFLGGPRDDEKTFYEEVLRKRKKVQGKITEELWGRFLSHPQEDAFLTSLFRFIGPLAAQLYARPPKEFGLRNRDRLDINKNAELNFVGALRYVCDAFDVEYPDLFVPKGSQKIEFRPTLPPSVVVGRDMLSGIANQDLIFLLGKSIAYLRPSYLLLHELQGVYPEAPRHLPELRTVYLAILRLADPDINIPPAEVPRIQPFLPRLQKAIPREAQRSLAEYVRRHRAEAERADIVRWVAHAELATNRAGFVLCGDLQAAARVINSGDRLGQMTPQERIQDLVVYSYSEQHARLREALGLRVA